MTTVAMTSEPEPARRTDAGGTASAPSAPSAGSAASAPAAPESEVSSSGAFEDLFHAEYEPMVRLAFLDHYTRFANMAKGV